ncbi:hypothetical protein LSPH24S_02423 [Lysinibacillus sphaericus]
MADYWHTMILPMLEGAKMTVLLFIIAILVSFPTRFFAYISCEKPYQTTVLASQYVYLCHARYTAITTIVINLLRFTDGAGNR